MTQVSLTRAGDQPPVDDHGNGEERRHTGVRRLVEIARCAGVRFSADGCAFLAQALAFNAIFAVFPMIILTIAVLAFIYGNAYGETRAIGLIGTLAPGVKEIVSDNLQHIIQFRGISGAIAFVALLWSGKNLFQGLAYALNRALNVPAGRPLVSDILVSLVILPILAVLFIVATAVPLVISLVVVKFGGFPHAAVLTQIAGYGTGVILIFAIALVLYDYLPNRKVKRGFGIPGAIVFTLAWELAQIAFAIYTTHANYTRVYGALAAFAILLIWFYYMATIFLFGAQISAQWLRQHSPAE
ncbi:MAG: YihY/virulence factor BrkB family protein [Candidatus Eremiobacteraeota bacterium]|nr:YihY/virulence factor BrkB family protein [Candidatus Eremiobacteraeota bacterium]MBC5803652.1 YihY/virulence factor BrkB family protein [Candidatus Eremiobacteraeota bacterium]MBC5822338.1 YihY/virulence factor BrkB family protein [Candidatus Eremiobacteraeota bacterium]